MNKLNENKVLQSLKDTTKHTRGDPYDQRYQYIENETGCLFIRLAKHYSKK